MFRSMLEIGRRKQLFIDDYMIQSLTDAQQVLNTAVKERSNPVIRPDQPWEGHLSPIAKVLYDEEEKLFKMWYSTTEQWRAERVGQLVEQGTYKWTDKVSSAIEYDWTDGGAVRKRVEFPHRYVGDRHKYTSRLCYATSRDGVHWEKPNLGKVEFNGNRSNNILPAENWPPTFEDAHETDPAKRGLIPWRPGDRFRSAGRARAMRARWRADRSNCASGSAMPGSFPFSLSRDSGRPWRGST